MKNQLTDAGYAILAARTLIADERDWTRGVIARTRSGMPCRPDSKRARSFCMVGALNFAIGNLSLALQNLTVDAVSKAMPTSPFGVGMFNDTHTHAQVIAVLDKAIQLACAPTLGETYTIDFFEVV